MTIEKCKDFIKDGYGTWDDTSKPTTFANMHDYMKNQNNIVMNLAKGLWQPNTAYVVGDVVHSPSLPAGCKATCTTAGTTGSTEPKWTAYGTTVTDGGAKWKMETDKESAIASQITSAINSLHNTIKAEMKTAMLALFPVGSIIESTNSANPSTYIGGTWEQLPGGYTTVSAGTYSETHNVNGTNVTDTYVFTAGSSEFTVNGTKTRGEAKHQITEGELALHKHGQSINGNGRDGWKNSYGDMVTLPDNGDGKGQSDYSANVSASGWIYGSNRIYTDTCGGSKPHNTIQPVYGAYRFRRIS